MSEFLHFLVFRLHEHRLGVLLSHIERVVFAAEVTPVPDAPQTVLGVINVAGKVLPVLNLRHHLNLPAKPIDLKDHFILARTQAGTVVLPVDEVHQVVNIAKSHFIKGGEVLPGLKATHGFVQLDTGLLVITDLDAFFSEDHRSDLNAALKESNASEVELKEAMDLAPPIL